MWQEGRTWTSRPNPIQTDLGNKPTTTTWAKHQTQTEPRPRPRYDHHTSQAPESEPFTPLLTRMHKLIARILSATFSNDQLPLPTIHSFLTWFLDEIPFVLFMLVSLVIFFPFCMFFHVFLSTSFCMGFLSLFFCLFWFRVIFIQPTPLKPNIWRKEMRRHLNNNNHCTCWTFYATLAQAHQQWTQHHH